MGQQPIVKTIFWEASQQIACRERATNFIHALLRCAVRSSQVLGGKISPVERVIHIFNARLKLFSRLVGEH